MVIEILDNVKRGEFHLACYLYRFKILCTAIANFSSSVNELSSGSPSRIRIVLLISFGITTLPRSSILLTIPVAFMLLFHAFPVRSFANISARAERTTIQNLQNTCIAIVYTWQIFMRTVVSFFFFQHTEHIVLPFF